MHYLRLRRLGPAKHNSLRRVQMEATTRRTASTVLPAVPHDEVSSLPPEREGVVRRLITELTALTKEDRNLAVRKAFQAVQIAQERRNHADKQWSIALKILRRVVGGPTFAIDGQRYQIRTRDNKPFICILDDSKLQAA